MFQDGERRVRILILSPPAPSSKEHFLTKIWNPDQWGLESEEREGKLQIPVLVWSLVFGFAAGEDRTLAGFRRSYNSTADETISPGGFYHRLTPTLAAYLRDLVERGLDEVAVPDSVDADVDRFRDVMIADGTVLRLHEFLSDQYQGRHEEQAGAKLHLLHNATD